MQIAEEAVPPSNPDSRTEAADNARHIAHVYKRMRKGIADKEAVGLAEGALIRALRPRYNDRLLDTFLQAHHLAMSTALDLDLFGLVAEFQSIELDLAFGGVDRPPRRVHFLGFEVHTDSEREPTLSLRLAEYIASMHHAETSGAFATPSSQMKA